MPTWKIDFSLRVDTKNEELISLLAEAKAKARVIKDIPITPSHRKRLNKLNILRAIRGTTALEGNSLPEAAVERLIEAPTKAKNRDEQEVLNAAAAQEFITATLRADPDRPLDDALVREMHRLISRDIAYPHNEPGSYRRHPVTAADYTPPRTGEEVRSEMKQFFDWLNGGQGRQLDPIIRALAAHFFFISIHPFGDGNGRTARAIESYLLYKGKFNTLGFYSLANYYYKNRAHYIEALDEVRFRAHELTPFVLFCLRGFVAELDIVHEEVVQESRRIAYRDYARETLTSTKPDSKSTKRMLRLVLDLCLDSEPIELGRLLKGHDRLSALYAGKTTKTIRRDLKILEKLGLITIADGQLRANLGMMDRFSGN